MTRALPFLVLLAAACGPMPATNRDLQAINDDCLQTGGAVSTRRCCVDFGNFPATCDEDPCSACPEDQMFVAEYCDCPNGACFDGEFCQLITH